jgi:hypothetical protein
VQRPVVVLCYILLAMHLTRCSAQADQTLEEYFGQPPTEDWRRPFEAMLQLIQRLRALPDDRRVFALTSLFSLCLQVRDGYPSPVFVTVAVHDTSARAKKHPELSPRRYYIEFLVPERLAPWPNAWVRGEARSEDEAVQMILTAMEKSEGWTEGG